MEVTSAADESSEKVLFSAMKSSRICCLSLIVVSIAILLWHLSTNSRPSAAMSAKPDATGSQTVRQETRPSTRVLERWRPLLDGFLPVEERLDIARSINSGLLPAEVAFLYDALTHTPISGKEEDWWVVVNEIMEQMRKHGAGGEEYSARIGELIKAPQVPEVVRDYAIQHLAQWIAPVAAEISPGETNPANTAEALKVISGAARNPSFIHSTIAGTALMALTDISSRLDPEIFAPAWSELSPFLSEIITGQRDSGLSLRVSAIQAVAILADESHLPAIRALASNESENPSARLSAVAALGFYSSPEDVPLLETLASSVNPFQYAAKAALQRSNAR